MDNTSLSEDFLLFDPDYSLGMKPSFLTYSFQLETTCSNHQKNFHSRFKQLYEYLDQLLASDNRFISPVFTEETLPMVCDAKNKFKESSLRIIDSIKYSFEQDQRYQLLPDKFLQQNIEDLRQHLFISYNKMMQNVANLVQNPPIRPNTTTVTLSSDPKLEENRPRQKLKPGKTKFPKKARQVLESWYKNHSEDPFPSYSEKVRLAEEGGITVKQVKCWFINVRRKWKQELNDDEDFRAQIEKRLLLNNGATAMASNSANVFPQGVW